MEQKKQITNIRELMDWISTGHKCFGVDVEDNGLYIHAPNSSDIFVTIEKDNKKDDIISRII
jgi:hypothetical protein